jgi:hypothetical protein
MGYPFFLGGGGGGGVTGFGAGGVGAGGETGGRLPPVPPKPAITGDFSL